MDMAIEKYFNPVSHEWLLQELELKIDDARSLRLIRRRLRGAMLHKERSLSRSCQRRVAP